MSWLSPPPEIDRPPPGIGDNGGPELEIETAEVFQPLLLPARYKGVHGGRGGGKSHFFAELLVETAILNPGLRWVCIREVQQTLRDSVKRLIEDKIIALKVGHYFDVQRELIKTPGGGQIIFQGMQSHNAQSIKSLEGYDGAWVEEANTLSQRSLDLLRPTIRKEWDEAEFDQYHAFMLGRRDERGIKIKRPRGLPVSEIWFSWNRELDTDPVDVLLCGPKPPRDSVVLEANFEDNPWFPQVLRDEMEQDRERDLEKWAHVWGGGYVRIGAATIFNKRVFIEDFEDPEDVRPLLGLDFGFSQDPLACLRSFIRDDTLYISHEAFGLGVEIDETPEFLDARIPDVRKWPLLADSSRPETISYLARHGFQCRAADKWEGCVEDGIAHLKGFKRIVIHTRCVHMQREAVMYKYKVDPRTGDVLPIIVDAHNHGWDACRYSLDGYIQRRGVMNQWAALAGED